MSYILGIDLGTTNSCAAIYKDGKEIVLENSEGGRVTPSVVAFSGDTFLVGAPAKNVQAKDPLSVISSVKRDMGSSVIYELGGKKLNPQAVSAMILRKIKQDAEERLGEPITDAVITVPAYFDDIQRNATIDAGKMAGFNVRRILNEPSAAALAYGINLEDGEKNVLVFDFGGGTLDVSIVKVNNDLIKVVSTAGINDLGGDDFDEAIVEMLITNFYKQHKINLKNDESARIRLRQAAEECKRALTDSSEFTIDIPYITITDDGPLHIHEVLTKERFNEMISPILKHFDGLVNSALDDAQMSKEDIDEVLLVGGSTRVPIVQEKIKELTGVEPKKALNPDESVAIGAAIQGSIIAGDTDIAFSDITSLSLSIRTASDLVRVLIPRNTPIPCEHSHNFSTSVDNQSDVVIEVCQGERDFFYDNKKIGHFVLDGIPLLPKGEVKIFVLFSVDENGVLSVSAEEESTGKRESIKVTDFLSLSEKEIENAIRIAEFFKERDSIKKDMVIEQNNSKYVLNLLDDLLNSDKDLSPEEVNQIMKYIELENDFLAKEAPSESEVALMSKENLAIKSFLLGFEDDE